MSLSGEEKIALIDRARNEQGSIAQVAKSAGIPKSTLYGWLNGKTPKGTTKTKFKKSFVDVQLNNPEVEKSAQFRKKAVVIIADISELAGIIGDLWK